MAEAITLELGIEADCIEGARGEFSVRLGGKIIIEKSGDVFPSPQQCVEAVNAHIN